MKLEAIALVVEGEAYGDIRFDVKSVVPPIEAQSSDLTFLFDASVETKAGAVISDRKIEGKSGIVVKDPKNAMFRLLRVFAEVERKAEISQRAVIEYGARLASSCTVEPLAVIKRNAQVGHGTYIGAQCYIDEGVMIGANCRILPGAVLFKHTQIGNFVAIDSNTVIGKEGFGYVKKERYERIRHIGGVIIGDFVEIGSCVSIDRGTVGNTVIGEGTKIDNQVHIAHNVRIGKNCIIMGQAGIAGSAKIGDNVILCGQVGISDHLEVENDVIVLAKSGVFKSLKHGAKYSGIPAREHNAVLKALARLYADIESDK
ncbi:MAG: UDP-3-O-(3-hydroxymyristoyl)glucosamine N-acyltransferase [candidate division WOR-3 bacterium]|nr:MAG: UDP-3-O-(3-hydroxymyristoyl)glucosamine N-acyltransferase [candidate division WOR-3 bacterium]